MRYLLTPVLFIIINAICLTAVHAATQPDLIDAQKTFLTGEDVRERLQRLLDLEQQALALIEDEPLKMGSLGAAIIDLYPASQTGHMALSRYYEHLEAAEAKAQHDDALSHIQQQMQASGNGRATSPYRVLTIYDAQTFAMSNALSPVGSIYHSSALAEFSYMLIARPKSAPLEQMFFDLTHLLPVLSDHGGGSGNLTGWGVIRVLAADMDTAAQAAIGNYLTSSEKYEDALSWLKVASRSGNLLANTLLARIYWIQSESAEDEEARYELLQHTLDNYLQAITLGSTDAMYTLANLYLNDYYGEAEQPAAIPLLKRAGNLGHVDALIYLAHLHSAGTVVEQDKAAARGFYQQAIQDDNLAAAVAYARFLNTEKSSSSEDQPLFDTLERLASEQKDAQAMIMLGNLHARGLIPKASNRRATRWYKRAVKANPDNADVVNEVVWTLTVSDIEPLRNGKYALRTMTRLMENNEDAQQRPEYLDTWAAAYAATGDFERARSVQQQAIDRAVEQQREDVLDILKGHMDLFNAREPVIETAP